MPFQLLDLILFGIMLISGLLALMRGFTREVLSLVAWGAAAFAAYFAIKQQALLDLAMPYVDKPILAQIVLIWICRSSTFLPRVMRPLHNGPALSTLCGQLCFRVSTNGRSSNSNGSN